jgi:hypothetical protein
MDLPTGDSGSGQAKKDIVDDLFPYVSASPSILAVTNRT